MIESWLEYWCLPLNLSKCEASFFSVDPHQANLQLNLPLLSSCLCFNPTPTFLGVTFDHTLSFYKHVSSLKAKFFPRLKALRCISAFSWGLSKESLSLSCIKLFFGLLSLMLTCLCFLLHILGSLSLLAHPFLLKTCLHSLLCPLFPLHGPTLIPLSLPKVHLSLTLTLFPLLSHALNRRLCSFSFWQRRLRHTCQLLSLWQQCHFFLLSRHSMLKFFC